MNLRSALSPFILSGLLICSVHAVELQEPAENPPPLSQQTAEGSSHPASLSTLDRVTVIGQSEQQLSGLSKFSTELLEQLPQKNGSVNDSLTLLPRVQAGEGQRTSENAGEILPPLLSISGGRAYENRYAVDGVSLGSLLNPLADNPNDINDVPGHPQRSFLDLDLLDNVTVYDSNIPARYGRFVGGVVEARTRIPAQQPGARISLRSTRDSWTNLQIDSNQRDNFENSNSFSQQPRFDKYDGGLDIDLPLHEKMGLLLAYRRIDSHLELNRFNQWQDYDKTLENIFIKYAWNPNPQHALELSLAHTPSAEDFFIKNARNSDFTIKRGGTTLNGLFHGVLPFAGYELTAAYLTNRNSREAPENFYSWRNTPQRNWGESLDLSRSTEGGFGDIELAEQSIQLRADLNVDPLSFAGLEHNLAFGIEYAWDHGEYDRQNTASVHNAPILSSEVRCVPGDSACVEGEQYFNKRNIYLAKDQKAQLHYSAAYFEDLVTLGPVRLRPGLRLSHDDFLENTDLAYRFSGSWDVRNNGQTLVLGGMNRYYGSSLLTYKLREAIGPYAREVRAFDPQTGQLSPWVFDSFATINLNRHSELDTPYSDEWSLGIRQRLWGGTLDINYLERRNRDQFARDKVGDSTTEANSNGFFILNNNGSSDYASLKVAWQRQWDRHVIQFNYTWSDQQSSNESYDDSFDSEDLVEQIWYEGRRISRTELPRSDYWREHAFSAIHVGHLSAGFTMTTIARFLSGYQDVALNRLDAAERETQGIPADLPVYVKHKQPDAWTFDWRLDWKKAILRDQILTLSLEIGNLFNRTPPVAGEQTVYAVGRQFWLGASYRF